MALPPSILFIFMALDHLMHGEWRWFTRIGIDSMWAGAVMASRNAGRS